MDFNEKIVTCFIGIMILCLGILAGTGIGIAGHQKQAIEHGCARYHPQTGKFEWIKNANESTKGNSE